ncbi:hypothetical protein [Geodermatophilus ruber]|nr:hypothetical protein [Geodermatophilus ruber]
MDEADVRELERLREENRKLREERLEDEFRRAEVRRRAIAPE